MFLQCQICQASFAHHSTLNLQYHLEMKLDLSWFLWDSPNIQLFWTNWTFESRFSRHLGPSHAGDLNFQHGKGRQSWCFSRLDNGEALVFKKNAVGPVLSETTDAIVAVPDWIRYTYAEDTSLIPKWSRNAIHVLMSPMPPKTENRKARNEDRKEGGEKREGRTYRSQENG